ncbi:MAG: pirin family protein [Pseudomonadota bacterium]|nr:pirin family protein [Pseudomonadota bacterium]
MITLRRSAERGHADHGWLNSYHSFSFAGYQDPNHMGFGPLRVINEDRVAPGQGFGTHGHRDMEIISYVLRGALEHKDSMGNGSVLRPGYVQRMSAGKGVMHSEFNHSPDDQVHFLQIWIEPNVTGIEPGYEETKFDDAVKTGKLRLIASPDGRDGSVTIHQDACVYASLMDGAETLAHTLQEGRKAYVHVVRGQLDVNGQTLTSGDAAKLSGETSIQLAQAKDAEVLLFDLP